MDRQIVQMIEGTPVGLRGPGTASSSKRCATDEHPVVMLRWQAPQVAGITIEEGEEEEAGSTVVSDDGEGDEEEDDADSVLVTDDDEYEDVTGKNPQILYSMPPKQGIFTSTT